LVVIKVAFPDGRTRIAGPASNILTGNMLPLQRLYLSIMLESLTHA